MPKQSALLDKTFQALSDPTRRAVLERLGYGPLPVKELAKPFDMALPSFLQHLKMLESTGLVTSRKVGRVRTYQLAPEPMKNAENWLGQQRSIWEQRLNQLDKYLLELKEKQK